MHCCIVEASARYQEADLPSDVNTHQPDASQDRYRHLISIHHNEDPHWPHTTLNNNNNNNNNNNSNNNDNENIKMLIMIRTRIIMPFG